MEEEFIVSVIIINNLNKGGSIFAQTQCINTRAISFRYRAKFKFLFGNSPVKIEYQRPEDKFALLSLNDCQIMIEEVNGHWSTGELSYPYGRGVNFQITINDINPLYDSLKKNEYPIKYDIQENWYRADTKLKGQKEFLIMDPDGYLLRFVQNLGEKDVEAN